MDRMQSIDFLIEKHEKRLENGVEFNPDELSEESLPSRLRTGTLSSSHIAAARALPRDILYGSDRVAINDSKDESI